MQKLALPVTVLLTALLAACAAAGTSPTVPPATSSPAAAPQGASAVPTSSEAPSVSLAPSVAPAASPSAVANTITLSEWKVALPATMKAGIITFTIDNAGAAEHELIAFRSNLAPLGFPQAKVTSMRAERASSR